MTFWAGTRDRAAIASATIQPTKVQLRKMLMIHTLPAFGTWRTWAMIPGMKYIAPG
jgi:hypothetical protein